MVSPTRTERVGTYGMATTDEVSTAHREAADMYMYVPLPLLSVDLPTLLSTVICCGILMYCNTLPAFAQLAYAISMFKLISC